ncbi:NAD(P)H:quinone oxidoreductase [Nonomuraea sp. NPDC003804]|uniref:NAD(P)H:quinone oxidoreductase n=1 Tax=Nonomuraea sp. NPDC003804 TaxID=3154547 RepID=UPI0033B81C3D
MSAHVAVIYYSSTGAVHALAQAVADGAWKAAAAVRLRRIAETAPAEAIASNPAWQEHVARAADVPEATLDDLEWADAIVFGTPVRYGTPAAQLKQFIDGTGAMWRQGRLAGKVCGAFTAGSTAHGGQESTILALTNVFHHWGGIIVPPGYTDPVQFRLGNPYGTSFVAGMGGLPGEVELAAARHQGRRIAEVASRLAASAA